MPFEPDTVEETGKFVPDAPEPRTVAGDLGIAPVLNLPVTPTGVTLGDAAGVAEQAGAGAYAMGSMAYGGITALAKATVGKIAGLSFADTFKEEYEKTSTGLANAYVPLTPQGAKLTETLGNIFNEGIKAYGDAKYASGTFNPLDPSADITTALGILPPKNDPAAGAIGQAAAMFATLAAPMGKPVVKAKPVLSPLDLAKKTIGEFDAKYPSVNEYIQASNFGKRIDLNTATKPVLEIINRQLDKDLGLDKVTDPSLMNISLPDKIKMLVLKVGGDAVSPADRIRVANAYTEMLTDLNNADLARRATFPRLENKPTVLDEPIVVNTKGEALTAEQLASNDQMFRNMTPADRARNMGIGPMGELDHQLTAFKEAEAKAAATEKPADAKAARVEENKLKRMWANIFNNPMDTAKRAAALEEFKNLAGGMSYDQALIKVGPRKGYMKKQAGIIDTSGMEEALAANVKALAHLGEGVTAYAAAGLVKAPTGLKPVDAAHPGDALMYRATAPGKDTTIQPGSWLTHDTMIADTVYAPGPDGKASGVVTPHVVPMKDLVEVHPGGYIYAPAGTDISGVLRYRQPDGTPVTFGDLLPNRPIIAKADILSIAKARYKAAIEQSRIVMDSVPDSAISGMGDYLLEALSIDPTLINRPKDALAKGNAMLMRQLEKSNSPHAPRILAAMKEINRAKDLLDKATIEDQPTPTPNKQSGMIDISGIEANLPAAKRGLEEAAAKSWAVQNPAAASEKVAKAFEASQAATEAGRKVMTISTLKALRRTVVAHDYDLMKSLEQAGPYGEAVKLHRIVQDTATMAGNVHANKVNAVIFDDLSGAHKTALDFIVRARNIVEIDKMHGVGNIRHEAGITGPEAIAFLAEGEKKLGAAVWRDLNGRADRIFLEQNRLLKKRVDSGIIDQATADRITNRDYSRTEYLDMVDPVLPITSNIHDMPQSQRGSGIPFISKGKNEVVMMDSKLLLYEDIIRLENVIARNTTLQALHTLAREFPENGIVKLPHPNSYSVVKKGLRTGDEQMKHSPEGWTALGVRIDGKQRNVLMADDMAAQFISKHNVLDKVVFSTGDTQVTVASIARAVSGASLVRATSTTYNPPFIVAGIPMDILHLWMATKDVYSPHLPVYMAQLGRDVAAVAADTIMRKGRWEAAMSEGISGSYLMHSSRALIEGGKPLVAIDSKWTKIKTGLAYINDTQDMLFRMAHRERLMREGTKTQPGPMDSKMATAYTVERLNYARGGAFTKMLDTAYPYTAIGVNAASRVIETAAASPKQFATKIAWVMGIASAWKLANMITSPETDKAISPEDKARSFGMITFGDQWFVLDPDGNKRFFYIPIRADQTLSPFIAAMVAGLEKAEYGQAPSGIMLKTVGIVNPLTSIMPPSIDAYATYASHYNFGTDAPWFGGGKIKPEDEIKNFAHGKPTSGLAQLTGQATGASPMGLDAAAGKLANTGNGYIQMMGGANKLLFAGMDPRDQAKMGDQILTEQPFLARILKLTSPMTANLSKQLDDAERAAGSAVYKRTQGLDELLFKYNHKQGVTQADISTYINAQPPEVRKSLADHAKYTVKVDKVFSTFKASDGIPNKTWWIATAKMPPEARADLFHDVWLGKDAEERKRMEGIASNLQAHGTGYRDERFQRQFSKMRQLLKDDER